MRVLAQGVDNRPYDTTGSQLLVELGVLRIRREERARELASLHSRELISDNGSAEAFAAKTTPDKAFLDGLCMGLGFTIALVLLGGMRELIGSGTLFAQAELMFGESAKAWQINVFEDYSGMLLAILPPGAFIGLGFLIALKNLIDARFKKRKAAVIRIPAEAISPET